MNKQNELIHLKTGHLYHYEGEVIDVTNSTEGRCMVIYRNEHGQRFVRESVEFWQKFKWKEPSCCICGSTEDLSYGGAWYGYRCSKPDCQII